jgi:hypothetical protein
MELRHDPDTTPAAPGELELVRRFISVHEHPPGSVDSLAPSAGTIEWWLRSHGLIEGAEPAARSDLAWATGVLEDLRGKVAADGREADPSVVERLSDAARRSGLEVRFANGGRSRFETRTGGVRGAIGRLLGIAFLAELDGTWANLKACENPVCRAVFFDRSRNRSGKWCSMQSCGNRAKVRAFRERHASSA